MSVQFKCPNCGKEFIPVRETWGVCPNCGKYITKSESEHHREDMFDDIESGGR